MLWSRRLCLLGLLTLAGCGFTPVYAPGGSGDALNNQVLVDPPQSPIEFTMNRRLEDRLGRNSSAAFGLSYNIAVGEIALAVTPDNAIQRFHVTGIVDYVLQDRGTGAVVASGQLDNFAAYAATGNTVSAATARRDAEARLVTILADQLVARLLAQAASFEQ